MDNNSYYRQLASFLLCVGVLGLGSGVYYSDQAKQTKQQLQYIQQNSDAHMVSALSALETAIAKAKYSTGAMRDKILAEIMREGSKISTCLEAMPFDSAGAQEAQKFAAQAGAFACANIGKPDSPQVFAVLSHLERSARTPYFYGKNSAKNQIDATPALAKNSGDDYPALIYDGPYSEHIEKRQPELLKNNLQIPEKFALEIAENITGISIKDYKITQCFSAKIPYYLLESGDYSIEISQIGGHILNMTCGRDIGEILVSPTEAVQKAAEFLSTHCPIVMKNTYYELSGNYITINFAAVQGDILLYPDLIKISVALDDGSIIGVEATGFIMNHHNRQIEAPAISVIAARTAVSKNLKILSERLSIIPTDGQNEKLCYEFTCQTQEQTHCLVYISAETGKAQNILLLLENENGVLTA